MTTESEIGLTLTETEPRRPPDPFRRGAPNVLLVVLDDCGFAQLGCYGSPIATPTIDRLAAEGLRCTNFHTTAVCSPTRASALTGRNHHRVGMGMLPDMPLPFPAYSGVIPPDAATLPAILREQGWVTWAIGKWHLSPRDHRGPAGPFHTWPTGQGFDRYYGFLGGEESQWTPDLVRDQSYVDPPRPPEQGYHFTEDIADEAIRNLRELRLHQPDRPWMMYWATGAPHSPHQAPEEWIRRYEGAFDEGWDALREHTLARQIELGVVPAGTELSERPPWIEAWDDLDARTRRTYARLQEVFAGFLAHTDAQLGRVVACLEELGELDNTIVIVMSDNGASGEGGPHGSTNHLAQLNDRLESLDEMHDEVAHAGGHRAYNHYPWGWAHAGNTPLRRWKRYTLEGGVRDPLVVRWPAAIADSGGVRDQYCHVVDLLPTVLDLLGVEVPAEVRGIEQMSLDGTSLAPMLADPAAPHPRTTQYYECWGSRAMYHDGWKAVTNHVNQLNPYEREMIDGSGDFRADEWALFHVAEDFTESHDVAADHPDRLADLRERWWAEAERNQVLPLDDDGPPTRAPHMFIPYAAYRGRYELPAGSRLSSYVGPLLYGGFTVVAEMDATLGDAEGVIVEHGDWIAGWAWVALRDELVLFVHAPDRGARRMAVPRPTDAAALGLTVTEIEDDSLAVEQIADGTSLGTVELDARIPRIVTTNGIWTTAGYGTPFPVSDEYRPPFRLAGLRRVVIDAGPPKLPRFEAMLEEAMRHQ